MRETPQGPCFFCTSYVTKQGTTPAPEFLGSDPQPGAALLPASLAAMTAPNAAGLAAAVQHKDKLLSFAQSQAKRSTIIDDQGVCMMGTVYVCV